MATLFIHAPYSKGTSGQRYSFEYICRTGVGEGYAIWQKWSVIIRRDWKVVLLRCDKDRKRAEGKLVELQPTGIHVNGVQRYNVRMKELKSIPFTKEVEFNHYGVWVADC